jgi:hypothetical protein
MAYLLVLCSLPTACRGVLEESLLTAGVEETKIGYAGFGVTVIPNPGLAPDPGQINLLSARFLT